MRKLPQKTGRVLALAVCEDTVVVGTSEAGIHVCLLFATFVDVHCGS